MNRMKVVVPSLGRAGSCSSMKWLQQSDRYVLFAVHADEEDAYRAAYPSVHTLVLSDGCRKHAGLVRKEIMQKIREPFFFVDDDIRLTYKFVATAKDVFNTLEHHMESGASMAGLGQQLFCNAQMEYGEIINADVCVVRNKFVATVYGIDPVVFDNCPLERLPVYEDVALVIHAIQRGGGTLVSYCATHSNLSPVLGGCNSWRDPALTLQSLKALVELYPDICSIRDTMNTTHSQFLGIGLRTAWAKIRKLS